MGPYTYPERFLLAIMRPSGSLPEPPVITPREPAPAPRESAALSVAAVSRRCHQRDDGAAGGGAWRVWVGSMNT
jgi:hypothetical protein